MSGRPRTRTVVALFAVAVAVSVVHYVDNVANYHDYPQSKTLPNPSQWLIAVSWFGFTAAGLAGVWFLLRERDAAAAVGLAIYSGSGLVGVGHYTVAGATSMVWWRQAHIVADIACGVAMFVVALRIARATQLSTARAAGRPGAAS